jgi:quinol monooxygenase YgiN
MMKALTDKQKEVVQTLLSMSPTVVLEQGCLGCEVFRDLEDDRTFWLIEEWSTREDLDRYLWSDGFSVLLGTKSLMDRPLEVSIHTVSSSKGIDFVTPLRGEGSQEE